MPFCEIALEGSPVISLPSKMMRPPVGRNTPVRQLKNVLLPAPFGPIMARSSPREASKLICDSAARPPNWTDKSSVLRIGGNAAPRPVAGEPVSIEGCARTLGGEGTGGWEVCLVLRYRLEKVEAASFNLVQELAQERLVIGLAQRFV